MRHVTIDTPNHGRNSLSLIAAWGAGVDWLAFNPLESVIRGTPILVVNYYWWLGHRRDQEVYVRI